MRKGAISVFLICLFGIGAYLGWTSLDRSEVADKPIAEGADVTIATGATDASAEQGAKVPSLPEATSLDVSPDQQNQPESDVSVEGAASELTQSEAAQGEQNTAVEVPASGASPSGAGVEPETQVAALPAADLDAEPEAPASPAFNAESGVADADRTPSEVAEPLSESTEDDGKPRFDVVRVDSDGQTVIAGTAQPNEEVEVLLDGEVVGSVVADDAGAFVTVIFAALSGDAQQLQLRVPSSDADEVASSGVSPNAVDIEPAQPVLSPDEPTLDAAAPTIDSTIGSTGLANSGAVEDVTISTPAEPTAGELPVLSGPSIGDETVATGSPEPAAAVGVTVAAAPNDDPAAAPSQTADGNVDGNKNEPEEINPSADSEPNTPDANGDVPPADEAAPAVATDLAALAPVTVGDALGQSTPSVSSDSAAIRRDVTNLQAAQPSATLQAATTATNLNQRPSAGRTPDAQRYALSTPVIILPSAQDDGAPALIQPNVDELTVLQPSGTVRGVTLDRISYADTGDVQMNGRGAPGNGLRVYGNAQAIGSTRITGDGRWALSIPREVMRATQLLRFDELNSAGEVTSRIETPFQYSAESPQILREREVIVEKGDYLWRIAETYYGEGLRYSLIYGANSELIRDPDLIYPGQVFSVPQLVDAN